MTPVPAITAAPLRTRIGDYVRHYAQAAPGREAVVAGPLRLSYAALQAQIDRCSKALIAAGVGKGDRVALLGNPSPEFLTVFLAATNIGAVWLGLSPRYRIDEYRYIVGDARPSALFAIGAFEGRAYGEDVAALAAEHDCIRTLVRLDVADGTGQPMQDFLAAGEAVGDELLEQRRAAVGRLDPALIVYTSGSSGKPKGAVLSHYGLCFGNAVQGREFGVDLPRAVCPFPINHVACVGDTCCTTFIRGGTLVFMPRFDAAAVLETIERERINLWIGVPTMFILAADLPDFRRRDLSSLQTVVWGGAAMPRDYIEAYRRTGARLVTLYGLTEATTDTTFTAPDATLEELADTVGRPAPEYPCRIVREDGSPCDVGEAGEIQFKGEFNMLGYFNRPEATAAAFTADGWLRSGDIGYVREDGNLVFVARMSEMFKSGGFNVYPREIEEVIEQHPAVALAGVVGVADPLFGEVGEAHVLLRPGCAATPEEIIGFCRARLANYKAPKRVILRDELPMLPVGKVDKALLRRQAANG